MIQIVLGTLLRHARPDLAGDKHPQNCPHCGSVQFTRHGWYECIQRYRCKECRRTFSLATKCLDERIRLRHEFRVFLADFDRPVPVRADAEFIGVSATTIWRWRHRILEYFCDLAASNPRSIDGQIAVVTRSMSSERSRWSSETDLLWKRRGAPIPREEPKQGIKLMFVFAVRFDALKEPRGEPYLCTLYGGSLSERQLGEALLPHLLPSARVYGLWGMVGRRKTVREHVAQSPLAELYSIAAIPPDLECVSWEEMSAQVPKARMTGVEVIEARYFAARLHLRFAWWMRRFRAVRLHYVRKYMEWFTRLLDLELSGQIAPEIAR